MCETLSLGRILISKLFSNIVICLVILFDYIMWFLFIHCLDLPVKGKSEQSRWDCLAIQKDYIIKGLNPFV